MRYQMPQRSAKHILQDDRMAQKKVQQPPQVTQQLTELLELRPSAKQQSMVGIKEDYYQNLLNCPLIGRCLTFQGLIVCI